MNLLHALKSMLVVSVSSVAFAATTQVVTPTSFSPTSWHYFDDITKITYLNQDVPYFAILEGPAAAGSASVQIYQFGAGLFNVANGSFSGTTLPTITALSFSTYQPSEFQVNACAIAANECAMFLQLDVNFGPGVCTAEPCTDGNGSQGRLQYLPRINGAVAQDTWQTWNSLQSGALWAWSGYTANGNKWPDNVTNEYRTWQDILTAFPYARIEDNGRILLRAGEPYPGGFLGLLDTVTIGVNGADVTYDFELVDAPTAPAAKNSCQNDGWKLFTNPSFKNQGECIKYVNGKK